MHVAPAANVSEMVAMIVFIRLPTAACDFGINLPPMGLAIVSNATCSSSSLAVSCSLYCPS